MADRVVIVPGFMGSQLRKAGDPSAAGLVWYRPHTLLAGAYNLMQLDAAGTGPGPLAGGVRLEASDRKIQPGPWVAVENAVTEAGFEPVFWPYDWRLDIRTTAAALATFLAELSAVSPFYVLAYSMGGLLARLAYGSYLAQANAARWLRTVYVATPQFGSEEAAQYLARPFQNTSMLGIYGTGLLGYLPGIVNQSLLNFLNGKAGPVVASWPSIYQCLPDISTGWIDTRPLDPQLYQVGTYVGSNPSVNPNHLNTALTTRQAINATLAAPRPAERTVIGRGIQTPDALTNAANVADDGGYRLADGDGTVTGLRAGLPAVDEVLTLNPGEHVDLMGDGRLLTRMRPLLVDDDVPPQVVSTIETPPVVEITPGALIIVPPKGAPAEQRRGDP